MAFARIPLKEQGMSHFIDLLIETQHLLEEEANNLAMMVNFENRKSVLDWTILTIERMRKQADAIKEKMKFLGYHNCWEEIERKEVKKPTPVGFVLHSEGEIKEEDLK